MTRVEQEALHAKESAKDIAKAKRDEAEFRRLLPTEGFFPAYMQYTDRQESPGSFHFWTAATILGACLQRRTWLSKGVYNIYPNLFTVLIAGTGKCRKSRAMGLGVELLERFDWLNLMADKTTPEALLEALMVGTQNVAQNNEQNPGPREELDSTGIITTSEFAVFFGKQNYNTGMAELLTDLYDCRSSFKYVTRNRRAVMLKNIAVQILGASTPDWLGDALPASAFGGGFMSRFIFMVKKCRDRSCAWPEEPHPDAKRNLQLDLIRIRAFCVGKMALTPEAMGWFERWYDHIESELVQDPNLIGFVERKPDTVLKLAIILAASMSTKTITAEILEQAYKIVSWTQDRMFEAFKNVDLTLTGKLRMKVMDFIKAQGGQVTRTAVLRKFGGSLPNGVSDLNSIQETLVEAGQLSVTVHPNPQGKVTMIYKLVEEDQDE
jgi:hypothetical protein